MTPELIFFAFLIVSAIVLGFLIIIFARTIVYIIPMFNGPVFVPSTDEDIETMIKLAKLKKNDRIVDLGSGDGKIVIELAKKGYKVDGFEINPLLVKKSREKIEKLKLQNKAKIIAQSLWNADLSQYDVVMLYGTSYIMPKLQKKAKLELRKGGRIISNFFRFPDWQPTESSGEVHRYEK